MREETSGNSEKILAISAVFCNIVCVGRSLTIGGDTVSTGCKKRRLRSAVDRLAALSSRLNV